MTLKIVGAGFGRTGTTSVRHALGELGCTCYHMNEVLFSADRKADVDFWQNAWAAEDRRAIDWSAFYGDFDATLDFPGSAFWKELANAFPASKVILTLHPKGAEGWYRSTIDTIYGGTGAVGSSNFGRKVNQMMNDVVWNGLLKGTMDDPDAAMARYDEHVEEVRDTIPAQRLLVFSADQGWGPLTQFLGVTYREVSFPRANDREAMSRTMARLRRMKDFGQPPG